MVLALVMVAVFTPGDDCFPESSDGSLEEVHGEGGAVVMFVRAVVVGVMAVGAMGCCGGSRAGSTALL